MACYQGEGLLCAGSILWAVARPLEVQGEVLGTSALSRAWWQADDGFGSKLSLQGLISKSLGASAVWLSLLLNATEMRLTAFTCLHTHESSQEVCKALPLCCEHQNCGRREWPSRRWPTNSRRTPSTRYSCRLMMLHWKRLPDRSLPVAVPSQCWP